VEVFLANEQALSLDEGRLSALAAHVLDSEDVDDEAELSVLLVTPEHMKTLNARFAGEDRATDVLAFPMEDDEDATLMGDVVICPRVADANARRYGHSLTDELEIVLVHGTLHLLGYDHQGPEDRAEMDRRLREVLSTFKQTHPHV
jgi:probable rRNA maturation factor